MNTVENMYILGTKWLRDVMDNNIGSTPSKLPYHTWYENKNEYLIPLLGGQLIKEREVLLGKSNGEIEREISSSFFRSRLATALHSDLQTAYNKSFLERTQLESEISRLVNTMLTPSYLATGKLPVTIKLSQPIAGCKQTTFQEGTRFSRLFKLFIPNKESLERINTEYSKFFNQREVRGKLCLSVHPLDCFSVSDNDNGWRSCFSTRDGEYKLSTTGLLTSNSTMIAYIKSGEDAAYSNHRTGASLTWNSKKWRAYVTIDESNGVLHIGRQYPFNNEKVVEEIIEMVSEMTGRKYRPATNTETRDFEINTPEEFYNDGVGTLFYAEDIEENTGIVDLYVADNCYCMSCGSMYGLTDSSYLTCDSCEDHSVATCNCCGGSITREDYDNGYYHYIEEQDCYVCSCCEDEVYYCEYCNDVHFHDIHSCVDSVYNRGSHGYWNENQCNETVLECLRKGELSKVEGRDIYYTSEKEQLERFGDVIPLPSYLF